MFATFGRALTARLQGPLGGSEAPTEDQMERAYGVAEGLVAGTRVATPMGWRPVEALTEGDKVLTFDRGMQTVVSIRRQTLWSGHEACPPHLCPLYVPAGVLGNVEDAWLVPDQGVLVESDAAEALFGDPFSLVPAHALVGLRGIARRVPAADVEIITLHFQQDEVVFANIGALFYCPKDGCIVSDLMDPQAAGPYRMLSRSDAATLVELLALEDNRGAPVDLSPEIDAVA